MMELAIAKTAITGALRSLGNLRRHFANARNFLSDLSVDDVKRELRIIYFQEDYILRDVDAILLSTDRDRALMSLTRRMDESEFDATRAVSALLSDKILRNLRLDAAEVRELRKVADLKQGIRAAIRTVLQKAPTGHWDSGYLNEYLEIRRMIIEINTAIDEIELILRFRGVQVAEATIPGTTKRLSKRASKKAPSRGRRVRNSAGRPHKRAASKRG